MMTRLVIFLLFALCALAEEHNAKVKVDPPIPFSPPQPPSTTPTNVTTTTTPLPTSKPTNATTTTPPPTKPTNATTTTLPPTKPTNATTTTPPLTKPTTKPTTTPAPTPTPIGPPAVNNFTGNFSGSNRICLMMKVAVQIELLDKNFTKINVTDHVKYNVSCANDSIETLGIFWGNNNLTFTFLKNDSIFEIKSISAVILPPGANATISLYHSKPEFSVSTQKSYKCAKDQPLNLTDSESKTTLAKIHISHLQYQAFMNKTDDQYDSAWYCDATNTPDVVPVVVGCVLAVLVVLVLVAYLYGRRRCQARGYLSM